MIFDRYKKSFPAKLSLYVISFITILSFVLVGVFYHYSTETLSQEAEDKIESMAAQANLRVSALLSKVEKIPENLGWMIVEYVKEPDSLFGITRRIVKDNPEIFGCAIAFEPYYFPEKGQYFALNSVGSRIWEEIQSPVKISEVVNTLLSEYDVDRETCEKSVMEFIEGLDNAGLLSSN